MDRPPHPLKPSAAPRRRTWNGVLASTARTLVGALLLIIGAALLVLPGPGLLVIAAGLAVLAIDYRWPRRLLTRVRDRLDIARRRMRAARHHRRDTADQAQHTTKGTQL